MPVKNIELIQQVMNVTVSDIIVQSTGGVITGETAGDILSRASRAGVSVYVYAGEQLTNITYEDFEDVTFHVKELNYTGKQLTSSTEVFTYDGKIWTYDLTFSYTGEQLTSKSATLTII